MKQVLTGLILAVAAAFGALAATVTLYEVVAPPVTAVDVPKISQWISASYSPIGVGDNGETTYIEEVVLTKEVVAFDSESITTITSNPLPQTFTDTVIEGHSGLTRNAALTHPGGGVEQLTESCNFQGTTAGSCVVVITLPPPDNTTFSTSYAGLLVPVYTLTETASMPKPTETSGTSRTRGGVGHLVGLGFSACVLWMLFL